MIETSRIAYDFACCMTGYGHVPAKDAGACVDKHVETKEELPVKKFDALDYSRFAAIVDDEERVEESQQQAIDKQAKKLLGTMTGATETRTGEGTEAPGSEEGATSEFFDLKKSAAMQGCAHDRSKERALYERPNTEKLHLASRFRLDGNNYFKEKEYLKAGACYLRGLIQLEYTFPETEDEEKTFNDLKLALHLNHAAAKFNREDYDECQMQCDLALKIAPNNAKAYYRKGQCLSVWAKFDEAEKCFKKSMELDPEANPICEAALAKIERAKKAKPDRQFYKNIFK